MRFERKCRVTSVREARRRTSTSCSKAPSGVLAVESKLIEYIPRRDPANISHAYDAAIEALADPTWQRGDPRIRANPTEFEHFDVAQIVKHYLGLKSCFPDDSRSASSICTGSRPTTSGTAVRAAPR